MLLTRQGLASGLCELCLLLSLGPPQATPTCTPQQTRLRSSMLDLELPLWVSHFPTVVAPSARSGTAWVEWPEVPSPHATFHPCPPWALGIAAGLLESHRHCQLHRTKSAKPGMRNMPLERSGGAGKTGGHKHKAWLEGWGEALANWRVGRHRLTLETRGQNRSSLAPGTCCSPLPAPRATNPEVSKERRDKVQFGSLGS